MVSPAVLGMKFPKFPKFPKTKFPTFPKTLNFPTFPKISLFNTNGKRIMNLYQSLLVSLVNRYVGYDGFRIENKIGNKNKKNIYLGIIF
jgi:hypothetical protein